MFDELWDRLGRRSNGGDAQPPSDAGDDRDAAEQPSAWGTRSVADTLIGLVHQAGVELFHDADRVAYASFRLGDHRETWPLNGKGFRRYLSHLYYKQTGKTAKTTAVADAISTLEGDAVFAGQTRPVHLRVAGDDQAVYLDLGDHEWRAVEITPAGWRIVDDPPVRFRRPAGMAALPTPVRGGRLDDLRRFVNLPGTEEWMLLVGWLVGALRAPGHPYPLLALHGEQGSAKSTTARLIRELIDPSTAPLRAAPSGVRDLMIAANGGWVLSYDNLSHIPQWLSDALCRLSTGGGFATRELYTNDEERIFEAQRPVMVTGIDDFVTRSDLLDRAILLPLPTIAADRRRDERTLLREWHATRPAILGALLEGVCCALRYIDAVTLTDRPRMADFALWVSAAEPGLGWRRGAFARAYGDNRSEGDHVAIAASPIGGVVLRLADQGFHGTATQLLERLTTLAGDTERYHRGWPTNAKTASTQLHRLAPNLRNLGYRVEFTRNSDARLITLARGGDEASRPSPPSHGPRPTRLLPF